LQKHMSVVSGSKARCADAIVRQKALEVFKVIHLPEKRAI
jgi:hypothetical protein